MKSTNLSTHYQFIVQCSTLSLVCVFYQNLLFLSKRNGQMLILFISLKCHHAIICHLHRNSVSWQRYMPIKVSHAAQSVYHLSSTINGVQLNSLNLPSLLLLLLPALNPQSLLALVDRKGQGCPHWSCLRRRLQTVGSVKQLAMMNGWLKLVNTSLSVLTNYMLNAATKYGH